MRIITIFDVLYEYDCCCTTYACLTENTQSRHEDRSGSGGVFKAFANKIVKSTYFIKMLAATVSDRCFAEKYLM